MAQQDLGFVESGMIVSYGSLLIELAPAGRRQVFIGLMNTFIGPTMLLPKFGGALVDAINAPVVFALCAPIAWAGMWAASRLPKTSGLEPEALKEDCGCS